MKPFIIKKSVDENIQTAKDILEEIGVDMDKTYYSGYSDTNGVSVYFSHKALIDTAIIRVSGHGISNPNRMEETICFSFDAMSIRGKLISKVAINKESLDKNYSFLK